MAAVCSFTRQDVLPLGALQANSKPLVEKPNVSGLNHVGVGQNSWFQQRTFIVKNDFTPHVTSQYDLQPGIGKKPRLAKSPATYRK